jgi:hypothetical protein
VTAPVLYASRPPWYDFAPRVVATATTIRVRYWFGWGYERPLADALKTPVPWSLGLLQSYPGQSTATLAQLQTLARLVQSPALRGALMNAPDRSWLVENGYVRYLCADGEIANNPAGVGVLAGEHLVYVYDGAEALAAASELPGPWPSNSVHLVVGILVHLPADARSPILDRMLAAMRWPSFTRAQIRGALQALGDARRRLLRLDSSRFDQVLFEITPGEEQRLHAWACESTPCGPRCAPAPASRAAPEDQAETGRQELARASVLWSWRPKRSARRRSARKQGHDE